MKWDRFSPEPKKINLYGYWRSSASWRVRWALTLKNVDYQYIPVNILKEEHLSAAHLARSPLGTLPVLEVDGGIFLSESLAILEWIDEVFHLKGPALYPGTPVERARVRQLCEIINSGTGPLQTPRVQKKHSDDLKERADWARHFIERGLKAFDEVSSPTRKSFCLYNDVSAADLTLVPQIYNALRYEMDVKKLFPELFAIYERALGTEACKKAAPENQIDAVKESR